MLNVKLCGTIGAKIQQLKSCKEIFLFNENKTQHSLIDLYPVIIPTSQSDGAAGAFKTQKVWIELTRGSFHQTNNYTHNRNHFRI